MRGEVGSYAPDVTGRTRHQCVDTKSGAMRGAAADRLAEHHHRVVPVHSPAGHLSNG